MNPQRVRIRDHFRFPEFLRDWGWKTASPLESRWVEVNGVRIHSRSSARGDGPRILLIHGMVISSLYMIPLAETLARAGFEVHAIDLPGYGRSGKPEAPLEVPALADFVADWMRAQPETGAWHLVGNSFGCQVAADLGARFPELVATLAFVGMTIDPAAPTLFWQALRLFRDMPREPLRLWLNHVVDYVRAGPRFAFGAMRVMIEDRIETKLPRIAAPTLVIRGEHDPVTPRSWTSAAMAMLRESSFVEIPNGSHAVHYAAPDAVAEAIAPFVKRYAMTSFTTVPLTSVSRKSRPAYR